MSDLAGRIGPCRPSVSRWSRSSSTRVCERSKRPPASRSRSSAWPAAFPGADDPEAYLAAAARRRRRDPRVPADRWDVDALYDPDPDAPGNVATRWGGFLDALERFDAAFFGISPREAATMDPQQRLLLEVAWEALEHAGSRPIALAGSATGVFVGPVQRRLRTSDCSTAAPRAIDAYLARATRSASPPGRLSYMLGLQGPEHVGRHRVLVVARRGAPRLPEPARRRVPTRARRRRQPDAARR